MRPPDRLVVIVSYLQKILLPYISHIATKSHYPTEDYLSVPEAAAARIRTPVEERGHNLGVHNLAEAPHNWADSHMVRGEAERHHIVQAGGSAGST